MYANSNEMFNNAFVNFDSSNMLSARESAFQLAMLIAAVGLAFAAYGSLLDEKNNMRALFSVLSLSMLVLSIVQYTSA